MDVKAGKIDQIATYKIDRLSRSLVDFTQLVELLRRHSVGLVSITQSFDSSTPMGRMVIGLLATFAEFERETIAERVRDKMRASRRRGLWTGGHLPFGYDVADRKLVVNEPEAERVRQVFGLYRTLGSCLAVAHELNARGWRTKSWKATLKADREQRDARRPEFETELRRLTGERKRLEAERRNVVKAIGRGAEGLDERIAELDAAIDETDAAAQGARRDLRALDAEAIDPEELRRALAAFEPVWAEITIAERSRVLGLLLERVTFFAESGEVEIKFRAGASQAIAGRGQG